MYATATAPFASSFVKHKEWGVDDSHIHSWKSALHWIGNLKGYHLHEESEVYHGEVIKQIVRRLHLMLKKDYLIVTKQLVRVDPHVQEIMKRPKFEYRNGQADACGKVLIYGIPGVEYCVRWSPRAGVCGQICRCKEHHFQTNVIALIFWGSLGSFFELKVA